MRVISVSGKFVIYLVRIELSENRKKATEASVETKIRLEEASGVPCLVRWFRDVSVADVAALPVRAIIIGGFGPDIQDIGEAAFRPLAELIRTTSLPVMGICGGHQVLGCIFGGDPWVNYPMRPLGPEEKDLSSSRPGMFKEWGFYRIRRLSDDPIFSGLPQEFVCAEYHYCEVKTVPPGFEVIASNENCRVQAMRHRRRPIWGTQFHWERYTDKHPHGRTIMLNFLRTAGLPSR